MSQTSWPYDSSIVGSKNIYKESSFALQDTYQNNNRTATIRQVHQELYDSNRNFQTESINTIDTKTQRPTTYLAPQAHHQPPNMADMSNEDPNVLEPDKHHTRPESKNPPPSSNPHGYNNNGDPYCECGESFAVKTYTMTEAVKKANECRRSHIPPLKRIAT